MKNHYTTPEVERLRVFLETNIAATVSVGAAIGDGVTKDTWDSSDNLEAHADQHSDFSLGF